MQLNLTTFAVYSEHSTQSGLSPYWPAASGEKKSFVDLYLTAEEFQAVWPQNKYTTFYCGGALFVCVWQRIDHLSNCTVYYNLPLG